MSKQKKLDNFEVICSQPSRYFSYNDFYRPLSELYDRVYDSNKLSKIRSFTASLMSIGATGLLTCLITEFPDKFTISGAAIEKIYMFVSLAFFLSGILPFIFVNIILIKNHAADKEKVIGAIIDREFGNYKSKMVSDDMAPHYASNVDDVEENQIRKS